MDDRTPPPLKPGVNAKHHNERFLRGGDLQPVMRDPLCLAMFAAWVNVRPDQLPKDMRAFTCKATMDAWQRVADAARKHIEGSH